MEHAPAATSSSDYPAEARAHRFDQTKKRTLFLTARVHPGESPSSHMLRGCLAFLLSDTDPRAKALREKFVIKIIPMLNPDGVARGYYRCDVFGRNLNRYYECPDPATQPSIYATKCLAQAWVERARTSSAANSHITPEDCLFYVDLHAHAQKRGLFVFGNHIPFQNQQVRNVAFARSLEVNTPFLVLNCCNFSEKNMRSKDRRDGLSKEGSSRVALFKATGQIHLYTAEVNYTHGHAKGEFIQLPERPHDLHTMQPTQVLTKEAKNDAHCNTSHGDQTVAASSSSTSPCSSSSPSLANSNSSSFDLSWQRNEYLLSRSFSSGAPPVQYLSTHFNSMGLAICVSILDLYGLNNWSRLPMTAEKNVDGLMNWAREYCTKSNRPKGSVRKRLTKRLANKNSTTTATSSTVAMANNNATSGSKDNPSSTSIKTGPSGSPRN